MLREHVDPLAGDITACTVLMTWADWKALHASDWGALAGRLARRARRLYFVLTALSFFLVAQIVFMVSGWLRHGDALSLVVAALTAVMLLSFVTGERRLYKRQREVIDRLAALAARDAQPTQPR